MLLLHKPSAEMLLHYLERQSPLDFSYPAAGRGGAQPPAGFVVDHTRIRLGRGEAAFLRGVAELQQWRQFQLGWVEVWPQHVPIRAGEAVAILARVWGVWVLNAARIIELIDESGPTRRFGFRYGTLPDHVEMGEERFLVEWDTTDDSVWFDILAFSLPRHPLARLAYAYVRQLQKRFGREAAAAVRDAVQQPGP